MINKLSTFLANCEAMSGSRQSAYLFLSCSASPHRASPFLSALPICPGFPAAALFFGKSRHYDPFPMLSLTNFRSAAESLAASPENRIFKLGILCACTHLPSISTLPFSVQSASIKRVRSLLLTVPPENTRTPSMMSYLSSARRIISRNCSQSQAAKSSSAR